MRSADLSDSLPKTEALPGVVVEQYRTVKGKKYGPYYFRVYRVGDGPERRQRKEYVRPERVEAVREACRRWRDLGTLPESFKRAARDQKRAVIAEQLGETAKYLNR